MNIVEAVTDVNLLGMSIKDHASFAPWKALLATAFGLPLDPDQLTLYRQCTGRTSPPSAQFKSVFLCIGRRGGKSVCAALMAVYLAVFRDWRPKLTAGERAVILLVAGDRQQSKILYRYIVGILNAPILNNLILNYTADSLDLKGNVTIEIVTRSYKAVRGRSVAAALLDEVAFWPSDDTSSDPDHEGGRVIVSRLAYHMVKATLRYLMLSENLSRHFRLKPLLPNSRVCYVLMA